MAILFGKNKNTKISDKKQNTEVTVRIERESLCSAEYACYEHIGTREYQQDSTRAGQGSGDVVFGILCDGMGGMEDGGLASRIASDAFADAIRKMDPTDDIPEFLIQLVHKVNEQVYALPSQTGKRGALGTTLTAAVITGNSLNWISSGDSRIYIARGQEIVCVTRDHAYSLELDEQVRAGKLSPEDAATNPHRDALISFLGMERLEILDRNCNPFILEDGDIVLLCSDGLYRSLSDSDILEIIERHREDLKECARVLPLHAFDKAQGNQDNTSVVLLRYQFSGDSTQPFDR